MNAGAAAPGLDSPATLAAAARQLYPEGPWLMRHMMWYRPYICPFDQLLPHVPPGSRVLDVGCGAGLFLALLKHTGCLREGVGFDFSKSAIDAANRMARRFADGPGTLQFHTLSVNDPWPGGIYDVVSIIDVMHHVPPDAWQGVLKQLVDHIRPGGRLIYKDMCRRPLWRAWANRMHDLVLARQWIHYAPIELMESHLRDLGMRLHHSQTIRMLWYGHELRVFDKPADGV